MFREKLQFFDRLLVSWTSRSSFGFRSEIPRDSAWSPDSSLLAVALDSSVALYDSVSNALHFTIVCSECQNITSIHFIGQSGRYIAVLGGANLVVCDIIKRSGASFSLFGDPISD